MKEGREGEERREGEEKGRGKEGLKVGEVLFYFVLYRLQTKVVIKN